MYCPNPNCPDRQETGVAGEYREGTVRCPYCNALLEPGEAPREEPGAGNESGRDRAGHGTHEVTVFLAHDPTEAAMIAGLLEENDIPCFQRVEGLHGEPALFSARWAPVPGQKYEIRVSSAAEEAARRLLEETFGPEVSLHEPSPAASSAPFEPSLNHEELPSPDKRALPMARLLLTLILLAAAIAAILQLLR